MKSSPSSDNASAAALLERQNGASAPATRRPLERTVADSGALDQLSAGGWFVASASPGELVEIGAMARSAAEQGLLLRTCQRVEVYGFAADTAEAPLRWHGFDALLHLAEVAAGLHSAVLGERQVLGQVRNALASSPPALRQLVDVALASARELRREERLSGDTGSLLSQGLALAGVEPRGRILVLGGGVLGAAIARAAAALGFDETVIAVRVPSRAPDIAGVRVVPLADVARLEPFAVIAGCAGSGDTAIAFPELPEGEVFLDLATPLNFNTLPASARRITIADLLAGEDPEHAARRGDLRLTLSGILARRLDDAGHTQRSPIGQLRLQVERQRAREAERIRRLHPEIAPDTVDVITHAIVNRLFHNPSQRLKSADDHDFSRRVAALFAVDDGTHS